MALSQSVPHSLHSLTPSFRQFSAAIERSRIQFQLKRSPKLRECLLWPAPRIPRGLRSSRNAGEKVQAISAQDHAEGQVEASPENGVVEEGMPSDPAGDGKKKSARRRMKPRKSIEEMPAEGSRSGDIGPPILESNVRGVEHSHLELGMVQGDGISRESSDSSTLREELALQNAGEGSGGGLVLSSSSKEIEQGPQKESKRRSRKVKESSSTSRSGLSSVSVAESEPEPVGRVRAGEERDGQGTTSPHHVVEEVVSREKEPVALETLTTGSSTSAGSSDDDFETMVEETGSPASSNEVNVSKNKPVNEEEPERIEHQELQDSLRSAGLNNLESDGNGFSEGEVQLDLASNNGKGSSNNSNRTQREKTVGNMEWMSGNSEPTKDAPEFVSPSAQQVPKRSDKLHHNGALNQIVGKSPSVSRGMGAANTVSTGTDDEVKGAEGNHSFQHHKKIQNDNEKTVSSFGAGEKRKASKHKGRSGNGLTVLDSLQVQNEESAAPSEEGETRNVPNHHTKSTRRSRTRKHKKKALQSEPEVESIVLQAEDVYDSIIWCTVHLKVEGELDHNERLYVVGANPELGGWDLSSALPLSKSEEQGLWENTLKIPRGTMLEYKYFTEIRGADPALVERCFGPEIEYFLPWKEGEGAELEVIRDTWVPDIPTRLPLLSWGYRWWEEIDSVEPRGQRHRDGEDVSGFNEEELGLDHQHFDGREVLGSEDEAFDPARRAVVTDSESLQTEERLKKGIRKTFVPREEPRLMDSMITEQRSDSTLKRPEIAEPNLEEIEAGSESREVEQKGSTVQVEILINSPQCTMQRMAILEDGKLAELLLEPVNTRVQVGNVYLGVVRQLLPGMTGVFMDIGGFQLALMEITRNQYPYTFPSISRSTAGHVFNSWEDEDDSGWDGTETDDDDEDEDDQDGDFDDGEDEGEDEDLDEGESVEYGLSGGRSSHLKVQVDEGRDEDQENDMRPESDGRSVHHLARSDSTNPGPISVNFGRKLKKWRKIRAGMQMIVQVKKEALGKKGPRLTAFPSLAGRFWVLIPGGRAVGVSRRITGPERKRLRRLAQDLQPTNFALTARSEAFGREIEELEKDLARLMETWSDVLGRASAAAVAAEQGMEGAVPVLLHRAMGQTLTLVRDFFNDKVTSYLQEVAPQLSNRVELYTDKTPIFDAFDVESEIEKLTSRRVSLPNGGYLVLEETEALVSIDVNGGTGVFSLEIRQEEAILGVNLAAARQIATELRLRDIGGIIVVDFIDMEDPNGAKQVVDEMRMAISRDRSSPTISEISEFGLMEMTRKRVRPSVTLTISDPCSCCGGNGRVQAHETTLSKIERALRRLLAAKPGQISSSDSAKWPHFILRVDPDMGEYLKGRKRKRITQLSAALKVWLNLKVALEFNVGQFQVVDQHRGGSEKRANGSGQSKSNQQNIGPGLLGKRVWPGKRRRNFASQLSNKEL